MSPCTIIVTHMVGDFLCSSVHLGYNPFKLLINNAFLHPQEAKMKKKLKVKLEMAKFLQQTLDSMSVEAKGRSSESAKEFVNFFDKVSTKWQKERK